MRIGKRLFPYPLLNSEKLYSQFKEATFSLVYDEELTEAEYVLKGIHAELQSPFIKGLIAEGKAALVCVVECPETMYRRTFSISDVPTDIRLPLADLNGKVGVSAFVIAKEDMPNYSDKDFLDDYGGISFAIEKDDILAVDDGFVNRIDFDEDQDTQKSSIFLVIKDGTIKDETMRLDYDSSKITINLPEDSFNIYEKMKRITKYQDIFFSILAIPALSFALSSLQKKGDSAPVDASALDYKWFAAFMKAFKEVNGFDLNDDYFSKMDPDLEAQKLLNAPVTKAMGVLFDMTMGQFGGNDDGN
jgi:hypothetical protein